MTIRVLVVDDQSLVRAGFRLLLAGEPDIDVVGDASNGLEAIAQAARLHPNVILMDIRMPELDGLEATRRILPADPAARVLILTTFDLDDYVYEALQAGASGFLLKHAPARELLNAVRVVAAGEALLAPSITKRLIEDFVKSRRTERVRPAQLGVLTERETEILALIAQGLSNTEIAAHLVLAEQTVKTHVSNILQKLHLSDRTQAAVYALRQKIVD